MSQGQHNCREYRVRRGTASRPHALPAASWLARLFYTSGRLGHDPGQLAWPVKKFGG